MKHTNSVKEAWNASLQKWGVETLSEDRWHIISVDIHKLQKDLGLFVPVLLLTCFAFVPTQWRQNGISVLKTHFENVIVMNVLRDNVQGILNNKQTKLLTFLIAISFLMRKSQVRMDVKQKRIN